MWNVDQLDGSGRLPCVALCCSALCCAVLRCAVLQPLSRAMTPCSAQPLPPHRRSGAVEQTRAPAQTGRCSSPGRSVTDCQLLTANHRKAQVHLPVRKFVSSFSAPNPFVQLHCFRLPESRHNVKPGTRLTNVAASRPPSPPTNPPGIREAVTIFRGECTDTVLVISAAAA